MAIAVAVGPRNRRRLTGGAVALALLLALAGAAILLGRSGGSGPAAPTAHYVGGTDRRYDANGARLVYGMTKQQVLGLVGPPGKQVGRCWQYPVNKLIRGVLLNAERVCFDGGAYSDLQMETDGVWNRPVVVPVTQ